MRISFSDGSASRVQDPTMRQRGDMASMRRRDRLAQMRERRLEREMRIQEMENKRIEKINERMARIENLEIDPTLCPLEQEIIRESRKNLLDMLSAQIARIYEKRAEREAAAAENEARETQVQIEERLREREEQAREAAERLSGPPADEEALAQADQRNLIGNLARADMNRRAIQELSQVRAARSMEALQLRHAIDSDNSSGFVITGEADETRTTRVPAGRENPDDFRNTHLRALETGIARLDEAILARVTDMYRRSVREGQEIKDENAARSDDEGEAGAYTSPLTALR